MRLASYDSTVVLVALQVARSKSYSEASKPCCLGFVQSFEEEEKIEEVGFGFLGHHIAEEHLSEDTGSLDLEKVDIPCYCIACSGNQ